MEEIVVSVIMPFYNAAQYLPDTLRSLAQQTARGFELIAVDDASTDSSPELVAAFAEEHPDIPVQLIQGKENVGDCSARNIGFQHARGRYICLLDADDLYAADYVKQLSEHIRKTDADFVFCGYDKLYEADRRTVPYEQFKAYPPTAKKRTVLQWYLLGHTHIGHWAAMYQRSFLEQTSCAIRTGGMWPEIRNLCAGRYCPAGRFPFYERASTSTGFILAPLRPALRTPPLLVAMEPICASFARSGIRF